MEDCFHFLIGDGHSVCNAADMTLGDQRPGFRPSGLEFSTSLYMTIKMEGVFSVVVIVTAFHTTIDTNFLLFL